MVSFYVYDAAFLILFFAVTGIFLYIKRKNLKFEKPLLLYRTKVGLKVIGYISTRFERQLKALRHVVIAAGYVLMAGMIFLLAQIIYVYFRFPVVAKAVRIPPFMPLVPYITEIFNVQEIFPPFYFTYWIIAVAIIAVFHECAHGIFARLDNIRVKSTGFGFLGPFLAAFVEPDEKQMRKKGKLSRMSILAAGSFANIVVAFAFLLLMWLFFAAAFMPSGVYFNTYSYSLVNVTSIDSVNGIAISNGSILNALQENNETNIYIEISAGGRDYIIGKASLLKQLNTSKKVSEILLYDDAPAIRNNITGAIIEINGIKISNAEMLESVMSTYSPNESIIIKTEGKNKSGYYTKEYNITLVPNPENKSRAFIGIGIIDMGRAGFLWRVKNFFSFKDSSTYYKPKTDGLNIFIYNLLWWIVMINFGVGLFNMLPVGIFDGGQFFYLTILAITKSEKAAKRAFSIATKIILLMFLALIILWIFAFR